MLRLICDRNQIIRSWTVRVDGISASELEISNLLYSDMSKNNLNGEIPFQLPPNAININLASNSFTGGLPYSISQMTGLKNLNLAHNQLRGQLNDMLTQLQRLAMLDLSYNSLTGNLPQSFGSLSSLSKLYLQNNQFTGSITVLASLPLDELNVANNHFTGRIPEELMNIDKIETEGNSWSAGPAPGANNKKKNKSNHGDSKHLTGGAIAAIVVLILIAVITLLVFVARKSKSKSSPSSNFLDEEKLTQQRPFTPLVSHELKELNSMESSSFSCKSESLQPSNSMNLKPPPSSRIKSFNSGEFVSRYNSKRSTDQITATTYTMADLQAATGGFDRQNLIGEGSIGCVYKAKYDGKIMAVKKIEERSSSEDFMDMLSDISKMHHPNITELVGYCIAPSCYLLIYDFFQNGSLYNFLHLSDDYSKPLTWNTRVRIALGTARAIEYLHEVYSPSTMHKSIKSANILLNSELNPHLSDCGLAMFYQNANVLSEDGYDAPECTKPSAYTLKSDVYSFGVVMLELLTGRMPFDSSKPRPEQSLVRWATPQLHDIDALSNMVDPALRGLYPPKSLSRFADIIALCVQMEPEFRPAMSEVVQSLTRCG